MSKDTRERDERQDRYVYPTELPFEKDGYVYAPLFGWSKPIKIEEILTRKFSILKSE